MEEVLVTFRTLVTGRNGRAYRARACGCRAGDRTRRWNGWIEFLPVDGGPFIRTPRETTQRNRHDTETWAASLTEVYLDGALERALRSAAPKPPSSGAPPERSAGSQADGFARVGGMDDLKAQVRRIVETVHFRRDEARRYGIVRNGILLHGPPGCGKTFFAQAMAEEFGLDFLRVPLESVVSKYAGGAPDAMNQVFEEARARVPCLLFFDEFDAIAAKRLETPMLHEQQMVDALLEQLDAHRETSALLIVAATNRFDDLDPAVLREGRFDYKVRVDNPDFGARLAILETLLRGRPHRRRLHLAGFAADLEGFSAAQIRSLVDEAALAALDAHRPISDEHLRFAYRVRVAESRYGGAKRGWDDLILPRDIKRQLQLIEQVIENPQIVRQLGITPPRGILLSGPPGTGKTTIARVLASETEASFFAVNAADIFSKWVGSSERRVKDLFERARARVPAIIFIDEIDAVMQGRGNGDSAGDRVHNAVVNMFLAEMDGLDSSTRVLVMGATNRPGLLDEALLRPGRLGERIEIPLPDIAGRRSMLELFSKKMRLAPSVDLDQLAAKTDGASGALVEELCLLAGRNALARAFDARGPGTTPDTPEAITRDDFAKALEELSSNDARRPIGFCAGTQGNAPLAG